MKRKLNVIAGGLKSKVWMVAIGMVALAAATATRSVQGGSDSASRGTTRNGIANHAVDLRPAERVERGKYLVTILGCNDCHTPFKMGPNGPEPDMRRMLSGHPSGMKLPPPPAVAPGSPWVWTGAATNTAFAGPWGVTYSPNLTPHPVSGILSVWDDARFIKAMRTGLHFGESRPIMPPMPWAGFGRMTDEDLRSIFAYLRSIPAIHNEVPDWQPPSPSAQREAQATSK